MNHSDKSQTNYSLCSSALNWQSKHCACHWLNKTFLAFFSLSINRSHYYCSCRYQVIVFGQSDVTNTANDPFWSKTLDNWLKKKEMRYLLRVRAVWTWRCSLSPIQSLETVLDRVHGRVYIKGFFHSPFLFVNSYIKKLIQYQYINWRYD